MSSVVKTAGLRQRARPKGSMLPFPGGSVQDTVSDTVLRDPRLALPCQQLRESPPQHHAFSVRVCLALWPREGM